LARELVETGDELDSISLFTGLGGLDIGLEKAGFSFRLALENDPHRVAVLSANRPSWNATAGDIREVSSTTILRRARLERSDIALISGGPPCQPFSKAAFWVPNRFRPYWHDKRRSLLREFARVVIGCKPKVFVLENVAGLAYATNRRYLDLFRRKIQKAGYLVSSQVLNSADYGVPQRRERLFVVGSREGIKFRFPKPTHRRSSQKLTIRGLKPPVTTGKAIGDLDDEVLLDSERVRGKWGHLLPKIPPGQNYLFFTKERGHPRPLFRWRSKYWSFLAKLNPDDTSWTIPARPGPYTGPFHWRNRRLRISEIMRLQTFPRSWILPSEPGTARSALGDATPPREAQAIGQAIVRQFL